MTTATQLQELLQRWQDLSRQGTKTLPEEICASCPELLEDFKRSVAGLAAAEAGKTLASQSALEPPAEDGTQAQEAGAAQLAAALSAEGSLPVLPGYDILVELGRGAMGVVYKARDRSRNQTVALKTMQGMDPGRLYLFKQEFRSLADLFHPNLVNLHELVSDGQLWFFTMELVEGVDFLHYVWGESSTPEEATSAQTEKPVSADVTTPSATTVAVTASGVVVPGERSRLAAEQLDRLRAALAQLADGIQALHQAGKLHRDIKPTNIMVCPDGRVVLLDFGLAADIDPLSHFEKLTRHIVGTIGYMAPEQAAGQPLSPASDWYSLGVILYQALTGRLPFVGEARQILHDKQEREPPPPVYWDRGIPPDLNDLCTALLRLRPEQRLTGADILQRLHQAQAPSREGRTLPFAPIKSTSLLGRDRHLAQLAEAFAATRQGQPLTLLVHGRSGVGKSSLVQFFLRDLSEHSDAVVLAGRCYEKESVPYKALDSLVDALSRFLGSLRPLEVEALLPRDAWTLARVFPVLRQVRAIAQARGRDADITDPQESRRRAGLALRDLLARLGKRRPLILYIDDLQWGDSDSAALLAELLRPPQAPVFLLLGCFRSENRDNSPFIQTLLQTATKGVERRELPVEPLTAAEARDLARHLLERIHPALQTQADKVARESGGNPLFVYELVHACQVEPDARAAATLTLDNVLWQRIQRLPAEARQLLEVLAVSGRPLHLAEAVKAAALDGREQIALNLLRTGRLLRATGAAEEDLVETYHDRIRETIVGHLVAEVMRGHHRTLAVTLEAAGRLDAEVLGVHWDGAGEPIKAGGYFVQAARQAMETLAFDHAATLWQRALGLLPAEEALRLQLRRHWGEALANAGRGSEAGPVYLVAAAESSADDALELHRRAAEQLLWSGHIDKGLTIIDAVLASMNMQQPTTRWRILWSVFWLKLRLWWQNWQFHERTAQDIPRAELIRVDTCWSVALGLSHVNPARAFLFQMHHVLLALRTGEPYRVARALGMEVAVSGVHGGRARQQTAKIFKHALALAEKVNHPHALGVTLLCGGIAAFLEGRWTAARTLCERSDHILREQCTGVAWELHAANFYGIRSLEFLGEIAQMRQRFPAFLEDAEKRGDLFAATNLRTRTQYLLLVMDDQPLPAREALRAAIAQWSKQGFYLQHQFELMAEVEICHYLGDSAAAWQWIERRWPALAGSFLLRVQTNLITMHHVHGRAAVALAAAPTTPPEQRAELLQITERDAFIMAREDMAWSNPQALLLRAAVAWTHRQLDEALALLSRAEADFRAADMGLYAAVAQRRRGQLLGGDQGRALQTGADDWMSGQQIRNPARFTAMYAPGFRD